MTRKLRVFTAPNGEELAIRPVNETLLMALDKQFPDPQGRIEIVPLPNGETERVEVKAGDEYEAALKSVTADKYMAIARLFVELGVVLRLNDEQKAEVEQYKSDAKAAGLDLTDSDKYIYVMYIVLGNISAAAPLINAIKEIDQPSGPKSQSGPSDTTSE
jgi:hypothetical protein